MNDDEDAVAWYENQKKLAREIAVQYSLQNMQKGENQNAKNKTANKTTKKSTVDQK